MTQSSVRYLIVLLCHTAALSCTSHASSLMITNALRVPAAQCICNYPYELALAPEHHHRAYAGSYHCNLFGLELSDSWAAGHRPKSPYTHHEITPEIALNSPHSCAAKELAAMLPRAGKAYFGASAPFVQRFWASKEQVAALPDGPPDSWQPTPAESDTMDKDDDADDEDGSDRARRDDL